MTPKDIAFTVVLPGVIVAAFVLLGRAGAMRDDLRPRREVLSLVAAALAFILGTRFVLGHFGHLPPVAAEEWLFPLTTAWAILSLPAFVRGSLPLQVALCVCFGACVALFPLKTALNNQVDASAARLGVGAVVALLVAIPMAASAIASIRAAHGGIAFSLLAAIAAGAPGLFFSSSLKLAQVAGVLAVCAGVFAAAALVLRRWEISRGAGALLAGLNATVWSFSYFYASAPRAAAILAALAPVAAAVGLIPALARRPRLCAAMQILLAAAIAAAGTAIAFDAMPKDDDPYG